MLRFRRRGHAPSLRRRLSAMTALVTIVAAIGLSIAIGRLAGSQVEALSNQLLAASARRLASGIDIVLYERYRDIVNTAESGLFRAADGRPASQRPFLRHMVAGSDQYAWMAYIDRDGIIRQADRTSLEGRDVASTLWFRAGRYAPWITYGTGGETGDWIGVDDGAIVLAAPVRGAQEQPTGVVAAAVRLDWVRRLARDAAKPIAARETVDLFVIGNDGEALIGAPAELNAPASLMKAIREHTGAVETFQWRDDTTFATAFRRTGRTRRYPRLDWTVVARQPAHIAHASAEELRLAILGWGALVGALTFVLGWFHADRIARPLQAITAAARRIRNGEHDIDLPHSDRYAEVQSLSSSLSGLVGDLLTHEHQLEELNLNLEHRVTERTRALEQANDRLAREIRQRRLIARERKRLIERLEQLAHFDYLTGAANRHFFTERGEAELRRVADNGGTLTLVLFDLDHFKRVNDEHGHAIGDAVLKATADTVAPLLRTTDLLGRLGGEEFAVLLPDTGEADAARVAERLRAAVSATRVTSRGGVIRWTASFGRAEWRAGETLADIQQRADAALYAAKRQGRNRVIKAA
ncbi:sensor domain-containing diguanylate cyclase [Arhodomonas sp. AD133]|uniref:sensor domain-containing diguanylate cyclase n=1 Tax=Arhodomonas sp. AD133 TaxID=3415009 RepID=UPI003EBA06AA